MVHKFLQGTVIHSPSSPPVAITLLHSLSSGMLSPTQLPGNPLNLKHAGSHLTLPLNLEECLLPRDLKASV